MPISNNIIVLIVQAVVVGDDTAEYSEVNQTAASEATQRQPTYLNVSSKNTAGR